MTILIRYIFDFMPLGAKLTMSNIIRSNAKSLQD